MSFICHQKFKERSEVSNLQIENLSSQCDSLISNFFSLAIEVKASKHYKLLLIDSMVTIGIQEDTERPYYSWLVPTYPPNCSH